MLEEVTRDDKAYRGLLNVTGDYKGLREVTMG